MAEVVLAVDIGGTKTSVALADRADTILDIATAPTPAADGPEAVVGTVAALATAVAGRAGDPITLRAVGVGTAGVVDVATGSIVSSTETMARWAGTPLTSLLRAALRPLLGAGAVVHVQNDVDAHAVGELRHGAAHGAASALVVAVGTGIGAGLIVDGRVLRGAHHVAGEIGHMPTPGAEQLRCPCGRFGHLEAIGSGVGMHRHYLQLGGAPTVADSHAVAALAAAGDRLAVSAMTESAAALGRALAGAVTLLDPEMVVITGGVARISEIWWDALEQTFRSEIIDVLAQIPLVRGQLGADAPLRGAAASAWELLEEST